MRQYLVSSILYLALITPTFATPHAFPVPFRAQRDNKISFKDLPATGTIKIFTITGEEVVELPIPQGQGLLQWNVQNAKGQNLSSGVYYYLILSPTQKTTGKLIVIR